MSVKTDEGSDINSDLLYNAFARSVDRTKFNKLFTVLNAVLSMRLFILFTILTYKLQKCKMFFQKSIIFVVGLSMM